MMAVVALLSVSFAFSCQIAAITFFLNLFTASTTSEGLGDVN